MRLFPILLFTAAAALCQEPDTAGAIMAKVAANQERTNKERAQFLYQQSLLVRMRRGNHKLCREERSEFTVIPGAKGFEKKLSHFAGKYAAKDKLVEYDRPHYHYKDLDIDGDLASDLADDFTGNSKSRDGIDPELFPLTASEQGKYDFTLKGKEDFRGRKVYRLSFCPKPKTEDAPWCGEALVDAAEYEPLLVTTRFAHGLPFLVKTLLGTNLKYLGFSLAFERAAEGVWFPVSYGGEFEVRAAFVYKRTITVSLANSGFKRVAVESRITYSQPQQKPFALPWLF